MAPNPSTTSVAANPFARVVETLPDCQRRYYSLEKLGDPRLHKLPYSVRVLLEAAVRNCDEFEVTTQDVEHILDWQRSAHAAGGGVEISHKPARVVLQDFTGVPAVVDLAAMRDAVARLGGSAGKVNPLCPADLVIDHSVQVDYSRDSAALEKNQELEFSRNRERFAFLKWGSTAFDNFNIVPPGSGIVHQVNLEYLARVVFDEDGFVYPDSLVGTDSHTTMIDGLGVAGWGVGGIEAEAVMLGQPISMVLPEVVGCRLTGSLPDMGTATDLVLTVTNVLRKRGVVGKFVEFFGEGCQALSLADRATLANMAPEYGATMGFFPVDSETLEYLRQTGRPEARVKLVEEYLRANHMFRTYDDAGKVADAGIVYSGDIVQVNLNDVEPSVAGPKRPHDRVAVSAMKSDFSACLRNKVGFKGFAVPDTRAACKFAFQGKQYELTHGSLVLSAITSCTNTSNPNVMLGAALLARNAVTRGLSVAPYIKTSLSPGSGVVELYLERSGLKSSLEALNFFTTGYGCQTCIGNSGDLDEEVAEAITRADLVVSAVLSGNRNFEGRVHPLTRANYLASPMLCVAYALVGRVDVDFEKEPLGTDGEGKPVFLNEVWPSRSEIQRVVAESIDPTMFTSVYEQVKAGPARWNNLQVAETDRWTWEQDSTYIHNPPFFAQTTLQVPSGGAPIEKARCLLNLGDSITTDHISPAGKIAKASPAGRFLSDRGVAVKNYNSLGSRRGNDQVMARGTFANIRLVNKLNNGGQVGPKTLHVPSKQVMPIFDAAQEYQKAGTPLIVLAGSDYGSGSSRDWAAKGPQLLGVRAVIAKSYERIHRSNLVGMGILPLQFRAGQDADSLKLSGKEEFTFQDLAAVVAGATKDVVVHTACGKKFTVLARLDTNVERTYFQHGGILQYVLRKVAGAGKDAVTAAASL